VTPDVQLDCGVEFGLTSDAPNDLRVFTGMTFRL
jgi:hypothetical protein